MQNDFRPAAGDTIVLPTAIYSDGIVVESSSHRIAAVELKSLLSNGSRQALAWFEQCSAAILRQASANRAVRKSADHAACRR